MKDKITAAQAREALDRPSSREARLVAAKAEHYDAEWQRWNEIGDSLEKFEINSRRRDAAVALIAAIEAEDA